MSLSSDTLPSSFPLELDVYPSRKPQISNLIAEETLTNIPAKYSDFAKVFFLDLASKLPKHIGINNHTIKLVNSQQPPYKLIYNLGPVKLETLKTYIETNLANGFIRPSKSPANPLIMFDRKSDGSFQLCINYQALNKLMIKNWYLLSMIKKSLDRLERAKQFTKLDLTNAYYQMRICKEKK